MIALAFVIAGLTAVLAAVLILTFHYIGKDYRK
jgi:hypothetical protein